MGDTNNTIIAAKVQLDTSQANAGAKDLAKNLKDVKGSLNDTATSAKTAGKELGNTSGSFSNIKNQLSTMPNALGGAASGVNTLNTAFKALLANPIGAIILVIVGALTALYKAFTFSAEGGQQVTAIFDGIGAVIQEIIGRATALAKSVYYFFTGDWKKAAEEGDKAFGNFGNSMVNAFNRGYDASNLLDEIGDKMRQLEVAHEAMEARLAKSKELLTDETASYRDKKQALKESGEAIDKYYKNKADLDDQEVTALAKKYNVEGQLQKLRKQGYENGIKEFDDYLQTIVGDDKIKEIEDAIKRSIESTKDYANAQRQQNRAENQVERQHAAELKEARDKAIEKEKEQRQQLADYTNKLTKLQQDNELALIKDGYEKQIKQLQNRIADEKRANEQAFKDKKLTKEQQAKLDEALDLQLKIQSDALTEQHNKDVAEKQAAFEKDMLAVKDKIRLDGINDSHEKERVALEIDQQKRLAEAIERYKDDQTKFYEFKNLLDQQFKEEQDALKEKQAKEDAKKKLNDELNNDGSIPTNDFDARREALDADFQLLTEYLDKKLISEQEYTAQYQKLSAARKQIDMDEVSAKSRTYQLIAQGLEGLSSLMGKSTAAQKATAIASSVLNTYAAAWQIFRNASINPKSILFPAQPYIEAGLAIVAGLKNIQSIVKVKTPGGDGGSQTVGSASAPIAPAAPLAPQTTSTKIIDSSQNDATKAPIRAYVVDSDNRQAADRTARLERAARLGG